tara:strand:- start:329 stop:571 length:243 start_codon:yes stop_codon:yes gene_type:complete
MYIFIISLLVYLAYLELSPGLGNIWFRLNANNIRVINLFSALNMILYPLKNLTFWYFENWDLNFFIYYIILKLVFNLYNY